MCSLYSVGYQFLHNLFASQFAGSVDVLAERFQTEIHANIILIQQHASHGEAMFSLHRSQLLNVVFRQFALTVCDEHNIGIFKTVLPHEPQSLIQRRIEIGATVKEGLCRTDLILQTVLFWKEDICFDAAGAGEVDEGKLASVTLSDLQQGQCDCLTPGGKFSTGGP